jgi:hypothetical protein
MPKSRHSKRSYRPKPLKAAPAKLNVRHLVALLPDQAALNAFLLQVDDVQKRRVMFEYVKPFIRFAHAEFPTTLARPDRMVTP